MKTKDRKITLARSKEKIATACFSIQPSDNLGQSTIEFILTLILVVSINLFIFQTALVLAHGNYVHYATFMAARAYLAAGPDPEDQVRRAKDVIVGMLKQRGSSALDRYPSIARGTGKDSTLGVQGLAVVPRGGVTDQFSSGDRAKSWMQGVRYTFRSKLFIVPFGGVGRTSSRGASPNWVTLTSESWLGREPTSQECRDQLGGKYYDNGC